MKILLLEHPRNIHPERCNDIANTPLSSCLISGYTAAMLEKIGHHVEIMEGHMDDMTYPYITEKARDAIHVIETLYKKSPRKGMV